MLTLSAFSIGVGLSYGYTRAGDDDTEQVGGSESEGEEEEEKEPVEFFTVDHVIYHVVGQGVVEIQGAEEGAADIEIPDEVTYEEASYQVTAIAENAFSQNKALESVIIPGSVREIPDQAFFGCTSLTAVEFGDGVENIGSSVFDGCSSLTKVIIPGSVQEIPDLMLKGCGSLMEIEIGEGVERIGDGVFEGCGKLEALFTPATVSEWGNGVLKDCSSLKEIVIGGSLKTIGEDLFKNCDLLESIEIQGDVELIEEKVFEGHNSLKSVKIGGNVDEIGKEAFKACENLETFELDKNKTVGKIGESAFEGCGSLAEFFIPGSLELIAKAAFKGCVQLAAVEIETGVKEIGESAFEGCESLVEVTIPATVKKVGEMAFKDCAKLTTVKLEEGVEEIGSSAFTGCGELKMVTIPPSVKEIGEKVFEGSSLEELTIPASMKVIKVSAFKNSEKLRKVTMDDGVEEIGDSAFAGCIALEELTLATTLNKIGTASFSGCGSLTELTIPDQVEEIGQAAFKNCEKIDVLLLGESLKEIGDSAFAGCIALPTVVLPKDITEVGHAVFMDCEALDSLKLSEGLKRIGQSAFEGCKVLPRVKLPETVAAIEAGAFSGCDSLKWVEVAFREPFVIDLSVFEGIHEGAMLKVPKGARAAFIREESWAGQFAKIIGGQYQVTLVAKGFGEALFIRDSLTADPIGLSPANTLKVRNDSLKATYMEGDSVMVGFMADRDYQIMDITVNERTVTDSLFADIYAADTLSTEKPRTGEYTIGYLDEDYTVAVEYEKIHYRLTIAAIGQGSVNYLNEWVQDTTAVFRIEQGLDAFVTFLPADNWRIKEVTLDDRDITSEVPKYQYTIKNIKKHTLLTAEYEEIPVNKYILTVYVSGKGEVAVDDTTIIRDDTWSAFFCEDTTAVLTFRPDEGCATKYLRVNGDDVTAGIADNQYTITGIRADINVNVYFAAIDLTFAKNGIQYLVTDYANRQVIVTSADNIQTLEVPATVDYRDETWQVTGINDDALSECSALTAVFWHAEAPFKAILSNPNALVYVKNEKYVAWADQNAIVDGTAKNITLTDGTGGNDFYCPKAFKARQISYTHNYTMETGITESKGWETIALPFDVQTVTHSTAGRLLPFRKWTSESEARPFWLYELTAAGYQESDGIKANTPYLISMPNNSLYLKDYRIAGKVTFGAQDVEVKATNDQNSVKYNDRTFVPNFTNKEDESILALNVDNDLVTYPDADKGSRFVRGLRKVYPFEAYLTTTSNTRSINVLGGMTTAIQDISSQQSAVNSQNIRVYDLRGVLLKCGRSMEEIKCGLKAGVYVVQGKKIIIK